MNLRKRALRDTLLTVAMMAVAGGAMPMGAQSFTLEQILGAPFPTQLTAVKQGSRIAWVFAQRGAQNVWVADGPAFIPRQVTHYAGDHGQPISSLRLTPDGEGVVFARGTEVNDEGRAANADHAAEQPKEQVWIARTNDGQPKLLGDIGCEVEGCEDIQLTPDGRWAVWETKHQLWISPTTNPSGTPRQLTDLRSNVSSPRWSPDGKRLVAVIGRHDHSMAAVLDVQDGTLSEVHYLAPSTDRDLVPRWSPDGTQIAFLRMRGLEGRRPIIPLRPVPWSVWVADARTYTAAQIFESADTPGDSISPFAADQFQYAADHRILFNAGTDGRFHLYSIRSSGGPATLLTPGDYDVEEEALSTDERSVLLSSNEGDVDRRHIWKVAVDGGTRPEQLVKGDTIEWSPVAVGPDDAVVCLGSTAITPGMVYQLVGGRRTLITKDALPKDFPASSQLVIPKQVIFKSSDGLSIHGQLFVPNGPAKPGPALIYTHGGPPRQMLLGFHSMDYYSNGYAANQYLASLGFTVLSVNYRLGIMYGRDFYNPPNAGWRGASEYNDVLAGAHYLQTLPNVDPKRIGLWGGSYGGYLTALGLARNSDIFKAGVDFHGVHDWTDDLLGWEEGADTAPDLKQAQALALASSPNASIASWRSPVLLIQGDDDRNVSFSEMVSLVQKLRRQHVPFEQIVFPDEIHDFLLWRDFITSYKATAAFFQKYLGSK